MSILIALSLIATAASAQDIPSPYEGAVAEQGQRQMMDTLARRRLQQARQRQAGGTATSSARIRAACNYRAKAAVEYGRDHPKVRRLYALCAQAGY